MDPGCGVPRWRIVRQTAAALAILVAIASADGTAQTREAAQLTRAASATLATTRLSAESRLPANLVAPHILVPLLEDLWQRSVSFRRQCVRLGEYPELVVTIELVRNVPDTAGARMLAHRRQQRLTTTIEIDFHKPALFAEHLAHELEHVLEEIDGIDLPRLARQRVAGVIDGKGMYETARAIAVGRAAAREARLP